MHYYDMYGLHEPQDEYELAMREGFPISFNDAKINELYGDLAFPDFNQIFINKGDIITKTFGKTITVSLNYTKNPATGGFKISRQVKEDMTQRSLQVYPDLKKQKSVAGDIELDTLDLQLKNIEKEFEKTSTEIAEIFC